MEYSRGRSQAQNPKSERRSGGRQHAARRPPDGGTIATVFTASRKRSRPSQAACTRGTTQGKRRRLSKIRELHRDRGTGYETVNLFLCRFVVFERGASFGLDRVVLAEVELESKGRPVKEVPS